MASCTWEQMSSARCHIMFSFVLLYGSCLFAGCDAVGHSHKFVLSQLCWLGLRLLECIEPKPRPEPLPQLVATAAALALPLPLSLPVPLPLLLDLPLAFHLIYIN